MVMLRIQEPLDWESKVALEDLASHIWDFVNRKDNRTPYHSALLALSKHLHSVHTNLANDDFAGAFAPLDSRF